MINRVQSPPLTDKEKELRGALPRAARPKKASTIILWKGPRRARATSSIKAMTPFAPQVSYLILAA